MLFEEQRNEKFKANCEILDTIDMTTIIQVYNNLSDVRDELEMRYDGTELTNNELLDGYILNHFNIYDLASYIRDRYKVEYVEKTILVKKGSKDGSY